MKKLPEQWAVVDSDPSVNEWFAKTTGKDYEGLYKGYMHFPEYSHGKYYCSYIQEGYSEISFEDFKRLVLDKELIYRLKDLINNDDVVVFIASEYEWKLLNDTNLFDMCDYKGPYCYSLVRHSFSSASTEYYNGGFGDAKIIQFNQINFENMKKEIIGYKAPFDLTDGTGKVAIKKGHLFVKEDHHYNAQNVVLFGLPKEIVEQWEPVYEESLKMDDWIFITGDRGDWWLKDTKESIFKVEKPKTNYSGGNFFGIISPITKESGALYTEYRKASPDEIESIQIRILIKEAEKRYPKGTAFYPVHLNKTGTRYSFNKCVSTGKFKKTNAGIEVDVFYESTSDAIPLVRDNFGKWAEIRLSAPKISIRGYEAKFTEDSVSFGCQTVKKDFAIDLFNLLDKNKIDMEFKKELQEIAMFFKKKENETSNNL